MQLGQVYEAIDSEIAYQDEHFRGRVSNPLTVGESILLLKVYIDRAAETWQPSGGQDDSLHVIRKIAAIAMRCMLIHGAPKRK